MLSGIDLSHVIHEARAVEEAIRGGDTLGTEAALGRFVGRVTTLVRQHHEIIDSLSDTIKSLQRTVEDMKRKR